ncbi:Uncharacterised protein [Shigella sonnei]|nr:Uncharacterised protein [Shigella sonnei]
MLLPPPVLVRMINAIEVITSCEMTSVTGTPFLFILANAAGSRFFCAVTYIPREGPTIQEAISARTPSNSSAEITRTVHSISGATWDIRTVKVCITPAERLISLPGMTIAIDKPPTELKQIAATISSNIANG